MRNSVLTLPAVASRSKAKRRGRDTLAVLIPQVKATLERLFAFVVVALFISVLCYLQMVAY